MNRTVGRACPQRADPDVLKARRAARRDGLALPAIGSRTKCMAPRPWQLPMNLSSGPWPLGRFSAGLRRVRGSSLKAAVRTISGSWAMCTARRPWELPVNCARSPLPSPPVGERVSVGRVTEIPNGSWAERMVLKPRKLSTIKITITIRSKSIVDFILALSARSPD